MNADPVLHYFISEGHEIMFIPFMSGEKKSLKILFNFCACRFQKEHSSA